MGATKGVGELEKFLTKHGPKIKRGGMKLTKDLAAAAKEGGEKIAGKLGEFGEAHPFVSASAAVGAGAYGGSKLSRGSDDDDASEAGRNLAKHRKRPYLEC